MPLPQIDPNVQKQLKRQDLRYISDSSSGFFRERFEKNFKYYDLKGKTIKSKRTLNRIKGLSIPPAWKNIWVSPLENGHLQATGIDEKGRKQYLYHSDWIKISSQNKFSKMVDFGLALPRIRERVRYHLNSDHLDKTKILATIIWLLDHTLMRIGNEEYSKENDSFGITTLRNRHVKVRGPQVFFNFRGKSGVFFEIEVCNPIIAKTIKKCSEIPGYELFQFIDDRGNRQVIDSEDVNLFLKDTTSDDFSAKDFRTWGATSLSAKNFHKLGFPNDKKLINKNIIDTVRIIAKHLNNTVPVCRNYYIHPTVIDTYQKNILPPHFNTFAKSKNKGKGLYWDEYALIKLLQKHSHSYLS